MKFKIEKMRKFVYGNEKEPTFIQEANAIMESLPPN